MATARTLFRSEDTGAGLRLYLHRTRAFKTVTARLVFHADLDGKTAARALVPRVLGHGTRRLPSLKDMQIELDRLYGAGLHGGARKVGERHLVTFRGDWITDRLANEQLMARMGDLFAEVLHDPAPDAEGGGLRASIVAQERKRQADEARAVFDDKDRYARHRLLETMCRDEAYARPSLGRLDEIEALDAAAVRTAYRHLLARAPAELFLVGDLTWPAARHFARRLALHDRRVARRLRRTVRTGAARVRTVRERQDVGQAKLAMGFRTSIRPAGVLAPALALMNQLFGGSPVGKLFKAVREKASLCYAIHSVVERTKGLVLVQAGIDAAHYARARRLIANQLDELRAGRFTAEQFAQARGMYLSAIGTLRDSPDGLVNYALERAVQGVPADPDALAAAVAAVAPRDIARAARTVELDTVFLLEGAR